jgi:hypothetical protein
MSKRRDADADAEYTLQAGMRDLALGLALLAVGVVTGGSALDGRADAMDYVFDGLAFVWILWGLVRLVPRKRPAART